MIVAVDHDETLARVDQQAQQILVARRVRRGEHQPVDLALAQRFELFALFERILARAAQEQRVAARRDDRLEAGDDLHEEGMHQIRDDDAERVRAAQREASCDGVGAVSELLDFLEHTGARRGPDVGLIVEDLRDGGDGDAELGGDSLHREGHRTDPVGFIQ